MAEYVVAHILDPVNEGDRFTLWPLHVTVLPPFQAKEERDVVGMVGEIASATESIQVQLGDYAQFGAKLIVRKLITNPELHSFHTKLVQAARLKGWDVAAKYVGDYYTPHVTRKAGRDYEEDSFEITKIEVVEALGQGYRRVVAVLPLSRYKKEV